MKFVKILHYVENSFEGKPSFVLLMSDGKEYISNGCQWVENTKYYRDKLISEYHCEEELIELLSADPIEMKDVPDSSWMFRGSQLTEFSEDMSSVKNATGMFYLSKLSAFNADMSSVENARGTFLGTKLKEFNADTSSVIYSDGMFEGTPYSKNI